MSEKGILSVPFREVMTEESLRQFIGEANTNSKWFDPKEIPNIEHATMNVWREYNGGMVRGVRIKITYLERGDAVDVNMIDHLEGDGFWWTK